MWVSKRPCEKRWSPASFVPLSEQFAQVQVLELCS